VIGKTVGKYRVVGQLGRGGMGTVYKAVDEMLDRAVAIKVINPELTNTKIMKRFRAEATTLAKLSHPEIATIYELFQSEKDLLLVMELVRGETLEHICLRLGALPAETAASLAVKVLSGLEHAHRVGIVHCDIKPANIMVTEHGDIKIMDFGTARMRGAQHGTLDGNMVGTPAYMSPEQVLGQPLDGRADLYAVGVVLYRLLTARLPFDAESAIAVVQKQIAEAPTPLHVHRADLPDWCEPILQRALAKPPSERFQSADEFREALRRASGPVLMELTSLAISIDDAPASEPAHQTVIEDCRPAPNVAWAPPTSVLADPVSPGFAFGFASVAARWIALPRHQQAWLAGLLLTVLAVISVPVMLGLRRPYVARTVPVSSARTAPSARAPEPGGTPIAPVMFPAETLVGAGMRQREARCRVVLADGKISVEADDSHRLLHELSYNQVQSISYSHGFDPIEATPHGPRRVAHAPRGALTAFGIFLARDWVTLRVTNAPADFVVLRFDNDAEARRAVTALEKRTGRSAERPVSRRR
jgi:serine/threonine-protein kinase